MNKKTEQLVIEMRKEIELIDKAIEQADKTYTMTVTENVLGLGKCYEGVYPKKQLWQAYRNLSEIKNSLENTCQLIIEQSQMHESLIQKMLQQPTITCVTKDTATTPIANVDSDTPCFENGEELNK